MSNETGVMMQLTSWLPINHCVQATDGSIQYFDWCKRELKRMRRVGTRVKGGQRKFEIRTKEMVWAGERVETVSIYGTPAPNYVWSTHDKKKLRLGLL